MTPRSGLLRVVATPLGNLDDLSPRARQALETADALAAEDTRRTGRLLKQLGISRKPILSYFAPKEREKARAVRARLRKGETVALVTDGGTPGVSDPGAVLVEMALSEGIRVEPIPGPSAVALALSVSPEGGRPFVFEGFLPAKSAARRRRLEELCEEGRPIVLYEAPHRLPAALRDLVDVLGPDRRGTIVREATKIHEEVRVGTLEELAARFRGGVRGEVVLVLEGGEPNPDRVRVDVGALLDALVAAGLSPERAGRAAAAATGLPRSRLVRRARERRPDTA
jgi:16S rRNA (cytidine1402-2'-O)-methyltransferase